MMARTVVSKPSPPHHIGVSIPILTLKMEYIKVKSPHQTIINHLDLSHYQIPFVSFHLL